MAVSIRDIAREAGVTVGTVSRALNNYPDVSPTTRERIVETAQRLGYRPNQMARNLSSKHNHNIALVLSGFLEEELINDFDALLMKGCFSLHSQQRCGNVHSGYQHQDPDRKKF